MTKRSKRLQIVSGPITEDEGKDLVRIIEQYCECRTVFHPQAGPVRLICKPHQWMGTLTEFPVDLNTLVFFHRLYAGEDLKNRDIPDRKSKKRRSTSDSGVSEAGTEAAGV